MNADADAVLCICEVNMARSVHTWHSSRRASSSESAAAASSSLGTRYGIHESTAGYSRNSAVRCSPPIQLTLLLLLLDCSSYCMVQIISVIISLRPVPIPRFIRVQLPAKR